MKVFLTALALLSALALPSRAQFNGGGGGDSVGSLPNTMTISGDQLDMLVRSGRQVIQTRGMTLIVGWSVDGYAAASSSGSTGSSGIMPPVVMETTWESPSGTQRVITPKQPHESFSNHAWRHSNAVNALLNLEPSISNFSAIGPDSGIYGTSRASGSTMIASWTSNDGALRHEVRTEPKEGEEPAEQAYRHSQSVKALQAVFPADKTMTPPKTGMIFELSAARYQLVA